MKAKIVHFLYFLIGLVGLLLMALAPQAKEMYSTGMFISGTLFVATSVLLMGYRKRV